MINYDFSLHKKSDSVYESFTNTLVGKVEIGDVRLFIKEEKARRSYVDFVRYVYGDCGLLPNFQEEEYVTKLLQALDDFMNDKLGKRVYNKSAAQIGKTTLTSNIAPAYSGMKYRANVIVVTYSDSLSKKIGRSNRKIIEKFGYLFGVKLGKATETEMEILDAETGVVVGNIYCTTKGGALNGFPADFLYIDDFLKNFAEAQSERNRELDAQAYGSVNIRKSARYKEWCSGTPYHIKDFYHEFYIEQGAKIISLAVMCVEPEIDLLGRAYGEYFTVMGKGKEFYETEIRPKMSKREYNSSMLGLPDSDISSSVKPEYIKVLTGEEIHNFYRSGNYRYVISADTAMSDGKNDYTVFGLWLVNKNNKEYILTKMYRGQWGFDNLALNLKSIIKENESKFIDTWIIENKGSGRFVLEQLEKEFIDVISYNPVGSKAERLNLANIRVMEEGNFYLANYLYDEVTYELFNFGKSGVADDIVDMISSCINNLYDDSTVSLDLFVRS